MNKIIEIGILFLLSVIQAAWILFLFNLIFKLNIIFNLVSGFFLAVLILFIIKKRCITK